MSTVASATMAECPLPPKYSTTLWHVTEQINSDTQNFYKNAIYSDFEWF
jgi:hypothetical protein